MGNNNYIVQNKNMGFTVFVNENVHFFLKDITSKYYYVSSI